jgi:hypothetical protein
MTVVTVIEVFHLQLKHRERGETVYERLHGDVDYRQVLRALPPGCVRVEAWETRYRAVWTCDAERCVITLVEGDVTVAQHDDEERYQHGLEDAARFYARHR